jgi:hypothetical protein
MGWCGNGVTKRTISLLLFKVKAGSSYSYENPEGIYVAQ